MSYCLNPNCPNPQNSDRDRLCLGCGSTLLLKDRYCPLKIIGQGSFCRTFLAVDRNQPSQSICVIKQFFPPVQDLNNQQKVARIFEQEAVRLQQLGKHPQIPNLLAYFTQENRHYLVAEFIAGKNLAQIQEKQGYFNELQIQYLLNKLLPVIKFIHVHKIIHGDIKPENIIRHESGQLTLVDFQATKLANIALPLRAKTGIKFLATEYMAPEQIKDQAIFASDLYGLGLTCLYLLTGQSPFKLFDLGEETWMWRQYLKNHSVSEQLGRVLDKLIFTATKKRYQEASEVLKDLNQMPNSKRMTSEKPAIKLPLIPATPVNSEQKSKPKSGEWRCVQTLTDHVHWVFGVAISPDGQTLATCSHDKTTKIWELSTGKLLRTLKGHSGWVRSVAFSPDGETIASSSEDKTIQIWQLSTGKLLHTLTGHSGPVYAISFSPDGRTLASCSYDKTIKLWNLETGKKLPSLMGHSHWIFSCVISDDGKFLVSGSYDKLIKVWHLEMGQVVRIIKGHSEPVYSVAISPDSRMIASGSLDQTIKLWQFDTGKEIFTIKKHCHYVYCVVFSPDSKIVASASADHTIKLWQVDTGKEICSLASHSDWVHSLVFAPKGNIIASASRDMTVKIWQCE